MPEMPDVVTLTTISSDWGNDIRDRTIQRYSSVANRTTEHPTPAEGDLSYLEDANAVDVYTGAAWVPVFLTNEVDGSVEVAGSSSVTGTLTAYATVNLTIPTGWASWKCEAHATCQLNVNNPAQPGLGIRIDGTDQQLLTISTVPTPPGTISFSGSVGGRRTGITTTGSRAVSLMAQMFAAGTVNISDMYLYARAVRTS